MGKKRALSPSSVETESETVFKQSRLDAYFSKTQTPPNKVLPDDSIQPLSPPTPTPVKPSLPSPLLGEANLAKGCKAEVDTEGIFTTLWKHSLLTAQTVSEIFGRLSSIESALQDLSTRLFDRHLLSTQTSTQTNQPTQESAGTIASAPNPSSPAARLYQHPPVSTLVRNNLVLVPNAAGIRVTIPPTRRYLPNWSSLTYAKAHLSSLLQIALNEVDVFRIQLLHRSPKELRFLLYFKSVRIPRLLFSSASKLFHMGVIPQRHFKNTCISRLCKNLTSHAVKNFGSTISSRDQQALLHSPITLSKSKNCKPNCFPSHTAPLPSPSSLNPAAPLCVSELLIADNSLAPKLTVPDASCNSSPKSLSPCLTETSLFPSSSFVQKQIPNSRFPLPLSPKCVIYKPTSVGLFRLIDAETQDPPPFNFDYNTPSISSDSTNSNNLINFSLNSDIPSLQPPIPASDGLSVSLPFHSASNLSTSQQ